MTKYDQILSELCGIKETQSRILHVQERILHAQERVLCHLSGLEKQGEEMAQELDDLKVEVEATKTLEGSIEKLLDGFKVLLDAAIASGNPADLKALSAKLATSRESLTAAVIRNTPAAPTP
jgi:hypothetical protein